MTPAPQARTPSNRTKAVRPVRHALEHALSIATAGTEDELLARALDAACDLTGAVIAGAMEASGKRYTHGDFTMSSRLLDTIVEGPAGTGRGGPTEMFALIGLPSALLATMSGTLIVIASPEPDQLGPEAASLLALVVAHAQAGRDRLREHALLSRRANSDPLTGLRHYRPFEERLATSEANRTAVIAIDVDEFKRVNDELGHEGGNNALVALVAALRSALRGDDHIYRIGGDEFAVVIDVTGPSEVAVISRRLLVAARRVGHPISVGAAMRMPNETGRETLIRADKALYQAKRAGRNTARLAAA